MMQTGDSNGFSATVSANIFGSNSCLPQASLKLPLTCIVSQIHILAGTDLGKPQASRDCCPPATGLQLGTELCVPSIQALLITLW